MASTTPSGGDYVVNGLFGGGGGVSGLFFWRRDGRGGMAICHFFLVDAGDGFFEEGGAGNSGLCPGGVATRTSMGKRSGGG